MGLIPWLITPWFNVDEDRPVMFQDVSDIEGIVIDSCTGRARLPSPGAQWAKGPGDARLEPRFSTASPLLGRILPRSIFKTSHCMFEIRTTAGSSMKLALTSGRVSN